MESDVLKLGKTEIKDTFAEAFRMVYARVGITAHDEYWLDSALRSFCGYGSSVIGCDAEVGRERNLSPEETPDGRIGAQCLVFGFSAEALERAIVNRVGQCLMTCPSTMVFDANSEVNANSDVNAGGEGEVVGTVAMGKSLRYFGDGYQKSKCVDGRRFWRIPVMEGEFVVEEAVTVRKGIAGGNFLLEAVGVPEGLAALRRSIQAIERIGGGVVLPFPGGAVRSGSKVGSRYQALRASTSHAYCPTLRSRVDSALHPDAMAVYEVVIDGVSEQAVGLAMNVGIRAAVGEGVVAIGAGNYGGKLGKFHFFLHQLLRSASA